MAGRRLDGPPSPIDARGRACIVVSILALSLGIAGLPIPAARAAPLAELVAGNLAWPVSVALAPDGRILYNERFTGRVRALVDGVPVPGELGNVSVVSAGEQGLLGLALSPDFPATPWAYVYHTYFNGTAGLPMNRVSRLTVGAAPSPATVILDAIPAATFHNGGNLAFAPDGSLFVTTGDAGDSASSQDPFSLAGKVLRLTPEGTIPGDNPIAGSYAYTIGHRNVFGLAFHPTTGRPYISENGPSSDDEVNRLEPGANYGWPAVTGVANDPRFIDPIVAYPQVIAPTGVAFVGNDLFLGDYLRGILQRITLATPGFDRVVRNETIERLPAGIVEVEAAPDGSLYVATPDAIYRVPPPPEGGGPDLLLPLTLAGLLAGGGLIAWFTVFRRPRR
ncbi:MAG TPA: PQQ-dependent sugar dehydrogenase [Thermoplasmata archaeon]|nr:PQQ-dependent sugar dehydrogenase [Thermoplasmata archaeon]